MHDVEGVQEPRSNDHLLTNFSSFLLFEIPLLLDQIEEVDALHKLGDNIEVGLCLDALLELQQEGVRHYLHYAALVSEYFQSYAIKSFASFSNL